MRLGIRLQILLVLGSLLALAFLPLFFAVASLTRASMASVREQSARTLGRALAAHVTEARASRPPEALPPLLRAQIGRAGAAAIALYDAAGARDLQAGEPDAVASLPPTIDPTRESLAPARTLRGSATLVIVPSGREGPPGAVAVLVRTDPSSTPVAPLVRLVALYTGVVAAALLFFAYVALTRLVVRPIDRLSREARRVAEGARRLEAPRQGARELTELGGSLAFMTERLRADEEEVRSKMAEVERYAADLARAQENLVRSERLASVGRLAAGIAHEIGNPIAAVLGLQELLLQGGFSEAEQRDFLERMRRETERVNRILRDLLDFARPAVKDGATLDPPGDVAAAVDDVVALCAPQKAFRAIDMRVEIAPDLPRVTLSRERVVQVLLNLLLNAADAAGEQGRVTVRAAHSPEGGVRLEVEDDGPGISPAIRDRLFEPFATTKEVGKGTGLGLAVCKGLVEAAGGSLVEASGDGGGRGARFVIALPAAS